MVSEWLIRIPVSIFGLRKYFTLYEALGVLLQIKLYNLVGVAQASTKKKNVGCAMLWSYFQDRVFQCVVWLNFHS